MHPYLAPIIKTLRDHEDKERAKGARAYMRNQFEFFGMPMGERRALTNACMKAHLPEYGSLETIVRELWKIPQRECQYFGVELVAKMKKQWQPEIIGLIEYLIVHKSWWDSVDHIASLLTGPYFKSFPKQTAAVTGRWNRSDNIWLQRSSIMFQKAYKDNTDTELLSRYILRHTGSKEFFIQKAIGWALREYAKTDPVWVRTFVERNKLAPLSRREALKNLSS